MQQDAREAASRSRKANMSPQEFGKNQSSRNGRKATSRRMCSTMTGQLPPGPPYAAGLRYASGVPPVSTLLEHADRSNGRPPLPLAPMPESRYTRDRHGVVVRHQERQLQDSLLSSQRHAVSPDERRESVVERAEAGRSSRRERLSLLESAALRSRLEAAHTLITREDAPQATTSRTDRPRSQDASLSLPNSLPTPPHETSQPDVPSLFIPETASSGRMPSRRLHPLSNTWRPDSPINGLGDRNRSPTPTDGWEIMRTTITPDVTLPSADSSFTSAAASQSFGSTSGTAIVERERDSSTDESQQNSSEGQGQTDSASSLGSEDGLYCDATEDFANDMYYYEMATAEGRERIRVHQESRRRDGDRFALSYEPERVDLGFRLIEEALESHDGRERLTHVGLLANRETSRIRYRDDTEEPTSDRASRLIRARRLSETIMDDEPASPHLESRNQTVRNVAREARSQVTDYFHRFAADALASRPTPPPPQLESEGRLSSSDSTTHDGPVVRPTSLRHQASVEDALVSENDDPELETMRRVIARIAQRDDVPDEWWTSIGLNLSRIRPSRPTSAHSDDVAAMAEEGGGNDRVDRDHGPRL
nr:hypothetical protein CFP56_52533 [Quercus suber]